MELIKQIKDAEKQAKDIVEKARQDAALLSEETRKERVERLKAAQQSRTEAIGKAVSAAEESATTEVEQIARAGAETVSSLKNSCSAKTTVCVQKVLSQLQQT